MTKPPSYRQRIALPPYGLYIGERVVASVRAASAEDARQMFKDAGLVGERVRRVGSKPK